ncbi:MAG: hypothetical protein PHC33_06445, partial [Candidatus Omnitrophica bacterium]|nr:hypothetical protein [Candidatus Omnitrophota bacterium]
MKIRPPGTAKGFLLFLLFFSFVLSPMFPHPALAERKPELSDMISYWSPQWLNNERIIYIKWIEHKKYRYGFIFDISNSGTLHLGEDYQVCTADLDGGNEKVIRTFSVRRNRQKIT